MVTHGLPDMYILNPRAYSTDASGVHMKQATHAHVTNNKYKTCNEN